MNAHDYEARKERIRLDWDENQNTVSFDELTPGSHERCTWRCHTCGYVWPAFVYNRFIGGTDCPACAGRVVTDTNNLAALHPDLAAMWDYKENGALTPRDVVPGSHKKAFFKCRNGHSYERGISQFVRNGGACKYCAGQAATPEDNLTVTNPDLVREWHPTRNRALRPEDFKRGSNAIVWWKDRKGSEWRASISKRAIYGQRSPMSSYRISTNQLRVYAELKTVWKDAVLDGSIHGFSVDVYIPSISTVVELDGYPWHESRLLHDTKKTEGLTAQGIRLIRMRDVKLPRIHGEVIPYSEPFNKKHVDALFALLGSLNAKIQDYLSSSDWKNPSLYRKLFSRLAFPDRTKSLAYRFPAIAREWDYEANAPMLPTMVSAKSPRVVFFRCPVCGESYDARVCHRTDMGTGCPYCSGHRVTPERSAIALHPGMFKDWDWDENKVDPHTLSVNCNTSFWWKCPHGHKYQAPLNRKMEGLRKRGRYSGCGQCYRERGARKQLRLRSTDVA